MMDRKALTLNDSEDENLPANNLISFIGGVSNPVERSLRSCILKDPSLSLIASEKVLYRRRSSNDDKVVLLSGGGSGHEPAHAGYLGEGALDIVVAGEIFASPSASQIVAGLKSVKSPRGTLMIVKNYTGDKLNFGLAAEKAKALGQNVNMVVVGEDVSVEGNVLVGQRGLAGDVFVHKIAGAKAAKGADLDEVTSIARKTASQMATVAASLDRCSVPGRANQESLPVDQLEYGMGIHNEPGVKRKIIQTLETIVKKALDMMFTPKADMWNPKIDNKVALMVNNLGGLSVLELGVVADEVVQQLGERDIAIERSLVGTFVTSLDGPGFSVTLLQLDAELIDLLDAATTAPAWPRSLHGWPTDAESISMRDTEVDSETEISGETGVKVSASLVKAIIKAVAKTTAEDEPKITEYDTLAGDGDCGETLLNGVNGLVKEFAKDEEDYLDIGQVFRRTASTAERSMGGTSGALYAIFLNAVANRLAEISTASPVPGIPDLIRQSLQGGLDELCRYTPARIGHRTLMDALIPFVTAFGASNATLSGAITKARTGAEDTRKMAAMLGRASYVGQDRFDEEGGIPDPGALGVGHYELRITIVAVHASFQEKHEGYIPEDDLQHLEARADLEVELTNMSWAALMGDSDRRRNCDTNIIWEFGWDTNPLCASTNLCPEVYEGEKAPDSPEKQGLAAHIDTLYAPELGKWTKAATLDDEAINDSSDVRTTFVFGPSGAVLYTTTRAVPDHVYSVSGADFSNIIEIRDLDYYGFVMPAEEIRPTAEEQTVLLRLLIRQFFEGTRAALYQDIERTASMVFP
ncbi:hypothetical protein G7046_g545 [Stylonectria norvegica]|nr:hypothetical protein G7046_g545 [Stylonectria norvegica]